MGSLDAEGGTTVVVASVSSSEMFGSLDEGLATSSELDVLPLSNVGSSICA